MKDVYDSVNLHRKNTCRINLNSIHLMQKNEDVENNVFCSYFEGGDGDAFNKDYFNPKL